MTFLYLPLLILRVFQSSSVATCAPLLTTVGNRLVGDGVWAYTYNDEGQLTKKSRGASAETWTYGYDHRGQMVWAEQRATDGGTLQGRVEYSYDAFGGRIRRVQRNGSLAVTSDELWRTELSAQSLPN